jgi:hypothetical protein
MKIKPHVEKNSNFADKGTKTFYILQHNNFINNANNPNSVMNNFIFTSEIKNKIHNVIFYTFLNYVDFKSNSK